MSDLLKRIWELFFKDKSAAWTALFTLILAWFSYTLTRVAQTSNEISVSTQRAFVNFSTINGDRIASPDGKRLIGIQFRVEWNNSGTTPTKSAHSTVNFLPRPSDLPKGFGFDDLVKTEPITTAIGPKATISQPLLFNVSALTDVQQGKSHLFSWGTMIYHDIFPGTPPRLTEYCVEIINITSTKSDPTDLANAFTWQLRNCPEHNCYDENCPDYIKRVKE